MVRCKQYDEAADTLHTTLELYSEGGAGPAAGRVVLGLILVQIVRGDSIAAGKVYSSWGGFLDSQQAGAAQQITEGFTDQDRDQAVSGLNNAAVKSLDNDYVKLARDIVPPAEGKNDEELDLC